MKKFDLMPLNLQFFAEPDDSGGDGSGTGGNGPQDGQAQNNSGGQGEDQNSQDGKSKAEDEPKYTDKQVNAIIDRKFAKWQTEQAAKVEEAKKLADMNTNQKKDYELEKANKAAAEAKAQVARYEMTATARKMASDADMVLTDEDLGHLVTEDADSTKANMDWLSELKTRISASVKAEFLKGNPPKAGGSPLDGKTGTYGAQLAKQNGSQKDPYFKTTTN
ncbi:DUF4355 domain-containing protein [Levilactobacillus brevis]|uniref:DUF4355 domain-containing protein n=1 Tax=Levilactobacillus brevis TaxID=1580 RepID=UPI0015CF57D1|nr:DUF4355 domain-containing protein [Levilactobacillus brevis]